MMHDQKNIKKHLVLPCQMYRKNNTAEIQ